MSAMEIGSAVGRLGEINEVDDLYRRILRGGNYAARVLAIQQRKLLVEELERR